MAVKPKKQVTTLKSLNFNINGKNFMMTGYNRENNQMSFVNLENREQHTGNYDEITGKLKKQSPEQVETKDI